MAIGWAIVSLGRQPEGKTAPALRAARDAQLAAVYSRDRGRAQAFAARHGAQAAYDSLEELLGDPRVEAAYIASPTPGMTPSSTAATAG